MMVSWSPEVDLYSFEDKKVELQRNVSPLIHSMFSRLLF